MTSTAPHSTPSCRITAQLDREWATLQRALHSVHRVRSWSTLVDAQLSSILASVESLDDAVSATHAACGSAGERLLREFVRLAPNDQLAGRIVVQRLLPGVLSAAKRYARLCNHDDPIAEAVGALWISILSFDGERRRGPVAASIISDTMFAAFRRRLRLRSTDEQPTEPNSFDDHEALAPSCPFVELATIVRDARLCGVPTGDLDLLRHLVRAESTGRVAHERCVTPRTIRNHRSRAIDRVREAIAA